MKLGMFFHLYQPAYQRKHIVDAVTAESYFPLSKMLLKQNSGKITMNVTGSLFEMWDKFGHKETLENYRKLAESNKVEFTASVKFHAFLPFLTRDQILRQIDQNNITLKKYLGENIKLNGFFPPEMAVNTEIIDLVQSLGYKWIIIDEIAHSGHIDTIKNNVLYQDTNSELKLLFRNRRVSNLIMSGVARESKTVQSATADTPSNSYTVTGMDGETFGHHRPGLIEMLEELISEKNFEYKTLSEISELDFPTEKVSVVSSTWASSSNDIEKGIQFLSWNDPTNEIHKLQKELNDLTCELVYKFAMEDEKTNAMLDKALASDHYWWASGKPWWSVEMIEEGAHLLIEVINTIPNLDNAQILKANEIYRRIVANAFEWQRTGKIDEMQENYGDKQRIPFKDRTADKEWEYRAFVELMEQLELEAAKKKEYEMAVLWRNAIYKLENKLDVFDSMNAIDLLRTKLPHKKIEDLIEKYKMEYKKIRSGQPEQRD